MFKSRLLLFILCAFSCYAMDLRLDPVKPLLDALETTALNHQKSSSSPIPIVAIAGCPGVGKTFFSHMVLKELEERGIRCALLLFDDFVLSPEEFKKLGTECDTNHRWFKRDRLHACLASIQSNERKIEKPTRNQLTTETGSEILNLENVDLILFDGLYSLGSRPPLNFFDYVTFGVFIEAEASDIYKWKWQREQTRVTPRPVEKFVKSMVNVFSDFNEHIAYSKANSCFVIKKESDHTYSCSAEKDVAHLSLTDEEMVALSNK